MKITFTALTHNLAFNSAGSLLLESKINPNTAYQKQQVSTWHGAVFSCRMWILLLCSPVANLPLFFFWIGYVDCLVRGWKLWFSAQLPGEGRLWWNLGENMPGNCTCLCVGVRLSALSVYAFITGVRGFPVVVLATCQKILSHLCFFIV